MPGADRFVVTPGGFLYHPSSVCVLENPMSEFSTGFCSFHLLHTSHVTGASVLIRSHHVKNILHNVIYTFLFQWYKLHNPKERILFSARPYQLIPNPKAMKGELC